MRAAALALALLLAFPARAEDPGPAPPDAVRWGLVLDGGFPQGAALSAVFRPVSHVRFWAGPAWNYAGFGVQGGIAVVPWHFALTPVLSAEVGRYFGADVGFIAREGQGIPAELRPLLRDMTYTYGAVLAGIEIGSQERFTLSLRAGLAYVSLATRGTVTTEQTDASGTTTVQLKDPRVRGTLPSVKLGVHYWF